QAVTAGPNEPPTAGFSYTCNGLTCNFTDTSEDSDGSIVARSWDFGDGETATAQHPSHTFPAANTFTVTLTVTDDRGGVDSFRQTVVAEDTISVIAMPGRIEVEDYKAGGPGVGYHDTTPGNSGGGCRSDDVDLALTEDAGGGCNLGFVAAGEWLAYDVEIEETGVYALTARVATIYSGRHFHIELDGVDVSGPVAVPNTGGWQTWADVTTEGVNLTAGKYELRIVMDTANFNLNYIDWERT
ncbi:MAG TPA: carbohydrate-binding protein, partial [Thermomicrobiales bacterium]|nr:carbohydrate-binding protein [Thermomicrobiales bacterium]